MKFVKALSLAGACSIALCGYGANKAARKAQADKFAEALKPRVFCRFVPERSDDFAFENNYIAMRFYGMKLRSKIEGAGCDCWMKRVEYPIVNKWYLLSKNGYTHHTDRGEGFDGYKVADSAGTGGTGIWLNGKRYELDTFTQWKILEDTPERCSFVLTYEAEIEGAVYKEEKKITLGMNTRLFSAESTFWKDGKIAVGLPIAVGLTSHDGKAITSANINTGWASCWEEIEGSGLGTAITMPPTRIKSVEIVKGNAEGKANTGHILFISETDEQGKVSYAAGYGWERAGTIVSQDAWHTYLDGFCKDAHK